MPAERLPQTLAERTDLPARVRSLLEEQLSECSTWLQPQLRGSLTELEQQLFKLAEQARNDAEQQAAFESLREVKRTRADAVPRFLLLLEARLATLGMPQARKAESRADLALVDPAELEEDMVLDDVASRAESHVSQTLFELGHRYAVLIATPLLESEALPLGPHALAQGLRGIAGDMNLPREHRMVFYRLCDRRLLAGSESLYGGLNEHLILRGILPNLRTYLPKRNPESKPRKRGAEPASEPLPPPPAQTTADTVMGNLRELLEKRRSGMAGEAANEPAGGYIASGEELQTVLATLQSRPPTPVQLGGRSVQRTMHHLRQDMLAELRSFSPDGRTPQFSPEHRDTVELISLLFDRLMDETRSGGMAQQLLARLQVPLLRAALADRSFFTQRAHPARRLLNTVAETAHTWMDTGEGEADAALGDKLNRTVDRVLGEFSGDLSLFERLISELESQVHALKRRAEIAERRQLEAAQGRDRLEQARARAASAIGERLAGRKVPPLTRALLEQAWCDALALAILRHGEDSEAFHRRLAAADELLREPAQRDNERVRVELEDGLAQIGLQGPEASQLARRVLDMPVEKPAKGETPTQTELAMRLKARQKLGEDETSKQEAEPAAPSSMGKDEQQAMARLKSLPFGTWFEFTINQQGQRVPRKLAWYTPATNRCLFVNARGTAGPERRLEQVARLMAIGQARVMPQREESLIDRAWNALVSGLRQFGMAPRTAATT